MRKAFTAFTIFVSVLACWLSGVAYAQAPSCGGTLTPGCLYFPATEFPFLPTTSQTTYVDKANQKRTIEFAVRTPIGAPAPMPVVIWSHGGAGGKDEGENSLHAWSDVTAAAGYLTISIAHTPRLDRTALCQAIGIPDAATCDLFKHLNWDRPFDISAVITELERMNRLGDLRGRIDLNRIAVAGHSAGAGATLTVAGALRNFTGAPRSLADPRPIAFLAFSPQQPGTEGFFDTNFRKPLHSWAPIRKPVLIGTGDGDNTCNPGEEPGSCPGDTPYGRRLNFDRMSEGNKYRIYVHDADAFHTLFAMNTNTCAKLGVDQAKCDEIARWLQSAALAFLDGHVRQDAFATQWLKSNNVGIASRGVAEWSLK
jgi:predicted dienelactone hydrolase